MYSAFKICGTNPETLGVILHICRKFVKNRLKWKDMAQTLYNVRNIYV